MTAMANRDRSEFKAGLFIIVTLLLIGAIVVGIKGLRSILTPAGERKVRFTLTDDVGGLRLGDDVRLGGYKVGVVRGIDVQGLGDREKPSILITFTMPNKYPLHANAHMAVQGTLTGSTWLNIDNLGSGDALADGAELLGHPSITATVLTSLSDATPELVTMLHEIHQVTVPKVNMAVDKASATLDSVHTLADRGSTLSTSLNDLFGDTKTDLRAVLANLNSITATLQTKMPDLLNHVDTLVTKVNGTLDEARGALADVSATAANAKDTTASIKAVVLGNRSKLDGMIASLKATSDNLKGASAELRQAPWRLLYHPGPGEIDNLDLYDAARQFADGASSVNDAAGALRDAMKDPATDKAHLQQLMNKLNDAFANFNEVEHKLWTAVKN